ncbi:hypothetical protein V500_03079, partial [Pseudogymnoascus sp. VKM F-4518 (FW-2643)]
KEPNHTNETKSTTMLVPPPAGALTAAFRVLCIRCVRAKARVKDGAATHNCVWSPTSSKCRCCGGRKGSHPSCLEYAEVLLPVRALGLRGGLRHPRYHRGRSLPRLLVASATAQRLGAAPYGADPRLHHPRGRGG